MFDRIRTIIDKEWAEVFKNRMVLFTITLLPLLFTIIPLAVLYATRGGAGSDSTDMPASFAAICSNMPMQDCLQLYLANEFLLLYMMMPLIIPITIAAYSIVGEKTTRSLEPLLATPITTVELLAGKIMAAAIPAIVTTWVFFGIFLVFLPIVGVSSIVQQHIFGPIWLVSILVIGPLMAILAVIFAVMVSSRVNDPRVAEQISAVLILPVMALFFGQVAGLFMINIQLVLVTALVLAVLDIGAMYLGASFFQRESILTRWK